MQILDKDVLEKFQALATEWRNAVEFTSSTTEMAMHPAYQRIIGMGSAAIPLLLRELEHNPTHWFWALKAITGQDPVAEEQRGRLNEMAAAWLKWGREHGYEW